MKKITIAGGGLAGLSLGIALRARRVPVELHEAGTYPRHRVCGEFINGVSEATLARLGIAEFLGDAKRHRGTRWFVGNRQVYAVALPEAALGISRHCLDARLADAFAARGGELIARSRLPAEAREGLVWAAGRKAEKGSRWIGLKVHAVHFPATAELEMHIGTAGYAGVTPVEGGRVNVCGLFRPQSGASGRGGALMCRYLELNRLQSLADRLGSAAIDERSLTGVSGLRLGRQRGVRGMCALGDAESIIPPFTGNGMSMAFEAAEAALEPLVAYAGGDLPWGGALAGISRALRKKFRRRLFTAGRLHPFLFSPLGRRALVAAARTGMLPFATFFRLLR